MFGLAHGYVKRKESTAKIGSFMGRSSCWCFHEASSSHLKTTPAIHSTSNFHCRVNVALQLCKSVCFVQWLGMAHRNVVGSCVLSESEEERRE